ncbi:MAG TPA: PD-(D/E)XK nuclease family protein [Verrucomicrobiae bacterium]|nr:PD-(D/E)XK nuclease family protein [Verrucomicrobiae bacterium]
MSLVREARLLQEIQLLNETVVKDLDELVRHAGMSALARQYSANRKKHTEIGFNLFELVSDHYYRETFHSDILHAFLDPSGKHQGREEYVRRFLQFLRSKHGAKINLSHYANVQVEKEKGKIDILIKDETSMRAVILENKINGAPDQPRQIPGYLRHVRTIGYACDAIIYLRLNGNTGPDQMGWTDDDRKQVADLLLIVSAYDGTENDLLNGWVLKCDDASRNRDAQFILRQYGNIIRKLGENVMNKPIMEKFLKIMVEGENFKTALSLRAMLDDLTLYRVERIIDRFKGDLLPFRKIANYQDYDAYFTGLPWKDADFGIDIVVEPELYSFQFWDRIDRDGLKGHAKTMLKEMGQLSDYTCEGGQFKKAFGFPSGEQALIEHISAFKKKLGERVLSN